MRLIPALLLFAALALAGDDKLAQGQSAFQAGDLAAAERLFREYIEEQPNSAEGLSNLAAVLSRRQQYAEAIALYQKALKANPQLAPVYFNLGIAQLRSGQYSAAASSFQSFLKSYPDEMRARQLLGMCLIESGELKAGIVELEKVLEKQPGEASVVSALAYAHARAGDTARGQQLLRQLESQPGPAHLIRGLMFYREEKYEEARSEFESCLNVEPGNAAALAALGRLHLLAREDDQALDYLQRAVQQNPHDAESTYQVGVLLERKGRQAEGVTALRRATTLRANYPDPYYQLAKIEFREGRFKEALADVEKAAELLPEHDAVRLLRGRIYQATGQKAKAQAEFEAVRKIKANAVEQAQKRLREEIPLQ